MQLSHRIPALYQHLISSLLTALMWFDLLASRFDRQNTFRRMDDCQFVAAMGPPGGGRNHITSRYARHFNVISITDFNDATLRRIFGTLLDWALHKQPFPSNIKVQQTGLCIKQGCASHTKPDGGAGEEHASGFAQEMRDSVVDATLAVYKKVMASLLPTPTKSHYTFNLRDISRVMQASV
ncbi:uncharacterized protein HaLaN_07507 [Haematococcus lacustris]|uniref:Dynein heavy chain 3 AAA+ lid domain-containing protein n=1 Tax=Haematococcus lacustris TaxID=44745 RepID=A0A699Z8Q3_HAELA|nr:uncharacterized protein HaLaN_07507 [Haematococcus lacustris]